METSGICTKRNTAEEYFAKRTEMSEEVLKRKITQWKKRCSN